MPNADTCGGATRNRRVNIPNGKHQLGWMVMKSQDCLAWSASAITEQGYRCSGCHKIGK